jgi:hypothetical protein
MNIKISKTLELWIQDTGCGMRDVGCWILDTGYWILDAGCWINKKAPSPFPLPTVTHVAMFTYLMLL